MKIEIPLQGTEANPEQQMRDWANALPLPRRQCPVAAAMAALAGHEHVLTDRMTREADFHDRRQFAQLLEGITVAQFVLGATTDTSPVS
ncbi:MAG: hypothetical protein KA795_03380 [Burkholderiaceae bacterium]|nr:hypothetical protein [Burkholderiaceae bacterium]